MAVVLEKAGSKAHSYRSRLLHRGAFGLQLKLASRSHKQRKLRSLSFCRWTSMHATMLSSHQYLLQVCCCVCETNGPTVRCHPARIAFVPKDRARGPAVRRQQVPIAGETNVPSGVANVPLGCRYTAPAGLRLLSGVGL